MSSDKLRLTNRRQFLATIGLGLVGSAALAACGAPAATPTAAPAAPKAAEPTKAPAAAAAPTEAPKPTAAAAAKPAAGTGKLVAWGQQSFTPEGDALLTQQFADFGKANNVNVEYVLVENKMVTQKIAAAIEAKATSDVQMLGSASDVQFYGSKALLVDLTDLWNVTSKQSGGFFDSVLDVYKADGKYLGIPFETHSFPLFTRLDLMEKATGKKEPPKTLDEMYEVSKKLAASEKIAPIGLCVGRTADTTDNFINLMWCDGAAYVDKNMKPTIKSDGTLTLLKRYQQWFKEKLIPADAIGWDDTGNNNAYQAKQTAFVINPPSPYDWLQKNDKELLGNTTMAPVPAGKGGSYSIAGSWSWSVFTNSKNVDTAKSCIQYLMEPDRLQAVYEKIGGRWYPVHKDLQKKEYWTSRPHFKYYPDLINGGRFYTYPAPPNPSLMQALGEAGQRFVIADMVQSVLVKNTAPEAAIDEAQKAFEDIFKKYGL